MVPYARLLRRPSVAVLLAMSLVARLPLGMGGLALVLLVVLRHGSYAMAGLLTAAYTAGTGVATPVLGRLADRYGYRPLLLASAGANAAALLVLAALPLHPAVAPVAVAAAAGLSMPPHSPVARSMWSRLLDGDELTAMFGLEATAQELIFIIGPALVALAAGAGGARAPVVLSAAVGLGGTLAFALQPVVRAQRPLPRTSPGGGGGGGEGGPGGATARRVARPRLPVLAPLLAGALIVMSFNAVEVAVVGFAGQHRATHRAGWLLAVWSLGSMAGGLLGAGRPLRRPAAVEAAALAAATAAFTALLALAPGLLALGELLALTGVWVAPALSRLYGLVSAAASPGRATEAFGWLASGFAGGGAVGAAAGGWFVQSSGPGAAFLAAAGAAAAASVVLGALAAGGERAAG